MQPCLSPGTLLRGTHKGGEGKGLLLSLWASPVRPGQRLGDGRTPRSLPFPTLLLLVGTVSKRPPEPCAVQLDSRGLQKPQLCTQGPLGNTSTFLAMGMGERGEAGTAQGTQTGQV